MVGCGVRGLGALGDEGERTAEQRVFVPEHQALGDTLRHIHSFTRWHPGAHTSACFCPLSHKLALASQRAALSSVLSRVLKLAPLLRLT